MEPSWVVKNGIRGPEGRAKGVSEMVYGVKGGTGFIGVGNGLGGQGSRDGKCGYVFVFHKRY